MTKVEIVIMAADFKLTQNLKMSPNSQIKNLVPENLNDVPPQEEWKLGRFWFNLSIGKLQGVFLKLDTSTGLPIEPQEMEVRIVGADALGPTKDGEYWPDGLFDFNEQTKISDAMDEVNEALKDLAPAEATLLRGDMTLDVNGGFKTGKISRQDAMAPDQLRMVGVLEGQEIDYITTDSGVTATLPIEGNIVKKEQQVQFGRADQGIITTFFDDVEVDEGINLGENFNEDSRDYEEAVQGFDPEIDQTTTDVNGVETIRAINPNKDAYRSETGALTINRVERYNDFKKWQRGTGTVNFGRLDGQTPLTPGRHTFSVEHRGILSGPYSTNDSEVFYDPSTIAPATTINSFSIVTGTEKYVSGVPFYNQNITFGLNLNVTNVFNYTYWDKPLSLVAGNTDAGLVDWNDEKSNLAGNTIPSWDDEINLTDYVINYTGTKATEESVTLTAKAGKVATDWGAEVSQTIDMLVDTNPTTGNSTWLKETFFDEDFRLKQNTNFDDMTVVETANGTWNSENLLALGEAQQYMGDLVVAQRDFTSFGVNADYTSFVGNAQRYYRAFKAAGKPNSNGTIKFKTTNNIETSGDIEVLIKFPGLTGWLTLTELYDIQIFANTYTQDGSGVATDIRKTSNSVEIDWTIGTNSTVDSGYGYVLQVIINNQDAKISEIEEISPNWR
jgi:hypothetical protein